ncbi:hypothetical protein ILUMI_13058 [Ignelater luminosus]|uniref:Uncharacterized protein n=1 Tax=Ignelater luminosus TaxID=2038154 RepID=A0A8K0G669_IGNLU|nr:hypothetical protein ILUMI_13058 [Ignelater luminosus]
MVYFVDGIVNATRYREILQDSLLSSTALCKFSRDQQLIEKEYENTHELHEHLKQAMHQAATEALEAIESNQGKTKWWWYKSLEQQINEKKQAYLKQINSKDKDIRSEKKINFHLISTNKWEEYYKKLLTEERPAFMIEETQINIEGERLEIMSGDIKKAINSLKNKKASGLGGIKAELIKNGTDKMVLNDTATFYEM